MTKHPLALAILMTACTVSTAQAAVPRRLTILSGSAARDVLKQCSRGAPQPGQTMFRPRTADTDALDRAVATSRHPQLRKDALSIALLRTHYAVEVVGMVRGGRRYVYGNYYPLRMQEGIKNAPSTATIVCDSGPGFFGAEIDTATGRLTSLAFNGSR